MLALTGFIHGRPLLPSFQSMILIRLRLQPYIRTLCVAGIMFIVDRATNSSGNAYSINSLQFASAVPEPGEWVLMLGGLGLMGFIARRKMGAMA